MKTKRHEVSCLYGKMSEEKYKNKCRTTPARLQGWDYGSHGLYFITICTKDKIRYFGEIEGTLDAIESPACLRATTIGQIAHDNWLKIPEFSPFVELDDFVIMPDYVHGILFINKPDKQSWELNKFGSQSKNLASIMRGYKSSVKTYSTLNNIYFAWQAKYYDHVIRNEKEYLNIKQYIRNNPEQWLLNNSTDDDNYTPL